MGPVIGPFGTKRIEPATSAGSIGGLAAAFPLNLPGPPRERVRGPGVHTRITVAEEGGGAQMPRLSLFTSRSIRNCGDVCNVDDVYHVVNLDAPLVNPAYASEALGR
jgi:hypothetical protein